MRTNASMTIYNKHIVSATRTEAYQRTQIIDVAWENAKANNVLKSGNLQADKATIYIPFARGENYLKPMAWLALVTKTGKWTLNEGDVIVKGLVTDSITSSFTIADLKAKYDDVLTIRSVDTWDQGSEKMQHWQIGAS